jgi:hypothetical protein
VTLIIALPTSCKVNDFDGKKTGKIQIKGLKTILHSIDRQQVS